MRLPAVIGTIFTVLFLGQTHPAIPANEPWTTIRGHPFIDQQRSSVRIRSPSSLSKREAGFIDHNAQWRTHYQSIAVALPAGAAAATCLKLLRFIIYGYIPRYQLKPKKNVVTAGFGAFQIMFASTEVIDLSDLASYAEALMSSPIASQLAGIWEVCVAVSLGLCSLIFKDHCCCLKANSSDKGRGFCYRRSADWICKSVGCSYQSGDRSGNIRKPHGFGRMIYTRSFVNNSRVKIMA